VALENHWSRRAWFTRRYGSEEGVKCLRGETYATAATLERGEIESRASGMAAALPKRNGREPAREISKWRTLCTK